MADPGSQVLAGTLDLLILDALSASSFHGLGLAQHIKRLSRDALRVEEGSLYPRSNGCRRKAGSPPSSRSLRLDVPRATTV